MPNEAAATLTTAACARRRGRRCRPSCWCPSRETLRDTSWLTLASGVQTLAGMFVIHAVKLRTQGASDGEKSTFGAFGSR